MMKSGRPKAVLTRREFLGTAVAGGFSLSSRGLTRSLSRNRPTAVDSRIEILLNESIATIAPELHGHFAEHLGAVVYDGIWVGEDSKIPNVSGIRKSLIDALQR